MNLWIADGKGLDPTVRLSLGHYFAVPNEIVNLPIDADDEIAMMRDAKEFRDRYANAVVMIVSNDEMSPQYRAGDYVGGDDLGPAMSLIRSLTKIVLFI